MMISQRGIFRPELPFAGCIDQFILEIKEPDEEDGAERKKSDNG